MVYNGTVSVKSRSSALISAPKLPVTLLTGFLGSGKTTLLNALLRRPQLADTVVIVNELGEIGLDHLLVESSSDNVILLKSGCLCCTIREGLKETLADLYVRRVNATVPRFARVVVETTGIADPGPVANSLQADALVREQFALDGIVTTVEALHGAGQLQRHPEAVRQVALADTLIITKADLAAPAAVAALEDELERIAPGAQRVRAVRGNLPPEFVLPSHAAPRAWLSAGLEIPSRRVSAAGSPHDRAIRSVAIVLPQPVSWAGLAAWCALAGKHFGVRLLRAKGLLEIVELGRPVAVHGIAGYFHPPEALADWPSDDHRSRLVCIVQDVDEAELQQSFKALALPPGAERPASISEL